MGEAIALAARLESVAEPGTVLVSEATYHLVAGKFHWIDLGQTSLKGLSEPVHVFRPLTLRSDAELLKEMQSYLHSAPLIGRYEEYNLMRQKVDHVLEGRGEIVLISGERGLGKTHLVRQVHKDLALRELVFESYEDVINDDHQGERSLKNRVLWLRGWCSSYEQQSLFFMWQILLKSWLGIEPDETNQQTLTRLTNYCEDLWPEDCEDYLPMLASLLSLSNETIDAELAMLDAQGYQGKLLYTLREWLKVLSKKISLILSLGNVQWANSVSVDLLRDVVSLSEDHPILWFIVYRPDRMSPVWNFQHFLETEYPHRLTLLSLTPFEDEESKALIEYILQPNKLDYETLEIIVERTEGNPYFIRELVNSLVNDGVLVKDKETRKWKLTSKITVSDLPESLHSLFLARIDKLSSTDRLVLQIASVVGFVFWKAVIVEIAPEGIDVTESLNNLLKVELIQEIGAYIDLGVSYQFSSTLIKDVTYESILSRQRRELHARIGEFLQTFQHNQEVSPSLLAHHFQMAGNLKLELFYRIDAAEQSRHFYANQEAYQEYSRALMILDEFEKESDQHSKFAILTQKFDLVKNRIEVLYHLGRVIDAHNEARNLLAIADLIEGDPTWRI
ncbi:MAG: AAA family ATPase, partial [Anaerolineales bacterium]|nr:AAA family ATPase [Anaerolineales bacterium]